MTGLGCFWCLELGLAGVLWVYTSVSCDTCSGAEPHLSILTCVLHLLQADRSIASRASLKLQRKVGGWQATSSIDRAKDVWRYSIHNKLQRLVN